MSDAILAQMRAHRRRLAMADVREPLRSWLISDLDTAIWHTERGHTARATWALLKLTVNIYRYLPRRV